MMFYARVIRNDINLLSSYWYYRGKTLSPPFSNKQFIFRDPFGHLLPSHSLVCPSRQSKNENLIERSIRTEESHYSWADTAIQYWKYETINFL